MNVQADIEWIQKELNEVKDPHLIEIFKDLLCFRKNKINNDYQIPDEHKKILEERLLNHESNPNSGRSWKDIKADLQNKSNGGTIVEL